MAALVMGPAYAEHYTAADPFGLARARPAIDVWHIGTVPVPLINWMRPRLSVIIVQFKIMPRYTKLEPWPAETVPMPPEKPKPLRGEYLWRLFRCKVGQTCVVRYNGGGDYTEFLLAGIEALLTRTPVIFDGECRSMCTSFADRVSKQACVTPRAVFRYHKGVRFKTVAGKTDTSTFGGYFDLPQRPEVRTWVEAHGGYPGVQDYRTFRLDKAFTTMRHPDTLAFWPECTPLPPPRPRSTVYPKLPTPLVWQPGVSVHGLY